MPTADEAAEQAEHLDRIRHTFDGRAAPGGPWQLATRVMVSLIHGGTLAVPDELGLPAVVLGFSHGAARDSVSSRAIRCKVRTVPHHPAGGIACEGVRRRCASR